MWAASAVVMIGIAVAGCDRLFLSEHADLPDGAPPIDTAPDAATCPGGATPLTWQAPTTADAVLIDPRSGSVQAFGGNPSIYLNYGTSIKSVGIWRFSVVGAPPAKLAMRVVLEWLPADHDCGGVCGSCTSFEEPGVFEIYPVRDQWDEATVSWSARSSTASWSEPGAAGADRGPFAGRAMHAPSTSLVFPVDVAIVEPWIGGAASFVVVPKANPNGSSGARMIVPALPPRTECAPPSPPAHLEIDYCP